jgi:hypothetical protein
VNNMKIEHSLERLLEIFEETLTFEICKEKLAEKASMTIDEFLAIIAHEMKEHEEDVDF